MKAHQRRLRERYSKNGEATPETDLSVRRARVHPISYSFAKSIIFRYEWLGTMASTEYHYGIFFGEYCGGVTCYGRNAIAGISFHRKFNLLREDVIILARGACVHWAPKNTNSRLIARSLRMVGVEAGVRICCAFADEDAGEVGSLYQATNWIYIGPGTPTPLLRSSEGRELNVRIVTSYARRNHISFARQMRMFEAAGWKRVDGRPKHRYVFQLDDDERLRDRIEELRVDEVPRRKQRGAAPALQAGEGGSTPTSALATT